MATEDHLMSAPMELGELRRRLAHALPPRARGWHALGALAKDLDALEGAGAVAPSARRELLAGAYGAAWEAILLRLRKEFAGLSVEDLEEVIQAVWVEIDELYERCCERARFAGYLWTTLRRRGLDRVAALRREQDGSAAGAEASAEACARESQAMAPQALRRFAWYHWGSQDHPDGASSSGWTLRQGRAAMVEFTALSCGLEGRPYAELVFWNQPRTGDWSQGSGEGDEKWWRNRATYARGKFKCALQTPEGESAFQKILEELRWSR